MTDIAVHATLEPIRNRQVKSLEWRMKELLRDAEAFKKTIRAAESQVKAYQEARKSLTSLKLELR